MTRLGMVSPEEAPAGVKKLYDAVQTAVGMVPNALKVIANSPAVFQGFMDFNTALGAGKLPGVLREQVAVAVAQHNRCHYWLSFHTAAGLQLGVSEDEMKAARRFESVDAKIDAALKFVKALLEKDGHVEDADVDAALGAGYDDGEIAELIANIAINTFTNFINDTAETEIDFPLAPDLP